MVTTSAPLYLGLDLSTQQLKALVITSDLQTAGIATVSFDEDLPHYGTEKGVLSEAETHSIYAPVSLWLEALDLVLSRLRDQGTDFSRIKGISAAGMQHGTVFWSESSAPLLASLDGDAPLSKALSSAFSNPFSPNWQDASTSLQCEAFDSVFPGGKEQLAQITGSSAHHRFSGPQIMRFRTTQSEAYAQTSRISLVSSFLASLFTGKIVGIDRADACGSNLYDIQSAKWDPTLLSLTAGSPEAGSALADKLGAVIQDGGQDLGFISQYFVNRYGFSSDCHVAPSTGDNPSTLLALPLQAGDAMLSLGTSTTFLMSTDTYKPSPDYHFMAHPTNSKLYMFMLCYKNGSLAREQIRDRVNAAAGKPGSQGWDLFNDAILSSQPLSLTSNAGQEEKAKMGLYFPRHEIVPAIAPGEWRFELPMQVAGTDKATPSHGSLAPVTTSWDNKTDARAILESQLLSARLRSQPLVSPQPSPASQKESLPAQPPRIYLAGGASVNPAITATTGSILGGSQGVYRLSLSGNACALGAAYKAVWAFERTSPSETFESFLNKRWREEEFVKRVDEGYRNGVFELYGSVLDSFAEMEQRVLRQQKGGD